MNKRLAEVARYFGPNKTSYNLQKQMAWLQHQLFSNAATTRKTDLAKSLASVEMGARQLAQALDIEGLMDAEIAVKMAYVEEQVKAEIEKGPK